MKIVDPSSRQFFEQKYREDADPWSFASDTYELRRYEVILDYVEAGRYKRVFEPGCSIGVLTEQLAERCERVLATDIAESAVALARRRCADRSNVTVEQGSLSEGFPAGTFDLIVFSEIGYYFSERELERLARRMRQQLVAGGSLIAAHWTGESADHVLTGPRVHILLDEHLDMTHDVHRDPLDGAGPDGFVLDMWTAGTQRASARHE
jgi:SAM-dependent methyltransferase